MNALISTFRAGLTPLTYFSHFNGVLPTVKVEEVYPKDYPTVAIAVESLDKYFEFYNQVRFHQALEYQTPATVYFQN